MSFRLESQVEPIPGYKLISRLGGGGFGEVWKAEAPGGFLKAIKFVYGDLQNGDHQDVRAEQELKSLSRVKAVRHPYILSLERFDIINGQLIIVMELADRNLWDRFRECRSQGLAGIPREELLGYLAEMGEALDLMNNEFQLQHLDIKPQNVFLVHNHVKIADFGLVKDLEGRGAASVTGGVTPIYAAPEMFEGYVSRYCDQYSLAIVYQELLTGHRPLVGNTVHQLVMQHLKGKPDLSALPPEDQEFVGRALSKTPESRFPSCTDLVQALRAQTPSRPVSVTKSSAYIPMAEVRERLAGALEPNRKTIEEEESPPTVPRAARGGSVHGHPVKIGLEVAPHSGEEPTRVRAPAEVSGEGELFPALVIGLGQMGLKVLHHLNGNIQENFGTRENLAQLRLLHLDTDPEAVLAANQGKTDTALPARDILLARLNRASHYLKPREGRPRIETWFNPNLLYRIQRNQVTGGLRALGRLAFIDNYRFIAQRLRADLEACTDPKAMTSACKHTGLKMRSNRPRVYLVTSLAGGTGGGIFIDLAYVLREMLLQLGYSQPEVVGLFLLPEVTDNPARTLALGNTFAALTELNHFYMSGVKFAACYDDREGTIQDGAAPFSRFLFWPEGNDGAAGQGTGAVGDFLFRDLTTPLGRSAEALRAQSPAETPGPVGQVVGLVRFAWPRRLLQQGTGRRLCRQLVERWLARDNPALRESMEKWIKEKWASKELGPEFMTLRLQGACERALGEAPEAAFAALTAPLTPRGWWNPQLDPKIVLDTVAKLEHLVGQPSPSTVLARPGILDDSLRKEAELLIADWKDKLHRLTIPLIELPETRLPGAEEAIRHLSALLDDVTKHHDPLCQDLLERAGQAHERFQILRPRIAEVVAGGRRSSSTINELLDLLRNYPKWRYQSMVLKQVLSAVDTLRNFLSDLNREVSVCRTRLTEMLLSLEMRDGDGLSSAEGARGRFLFPEGCRSLEDAAKRVVATVTPDELASLDQRVQAMIQQQFGTLINVCTSGHLTRKLELAMLEEAVAFLGPRLAGEDVVDMFLSRYASNAEAEDDLHAAFEEAAPRITVDPSTGSAQRCILALPPSPKEYQLRELARRAIPQAELMPAATVDDIVFYREETHVALADLQQLGPRGREAYLQMTTAEHFTPHSRLDITDWGTARK